MFDTPEAPAPGAVPVAPAAPPVLGANAQKSKPKAKSSQPSFLGTEAAPGTANVSNKTLLGQ